MFEFSRFVFSVDDALAKLGVGRHRHPDPLARWYTLMARSRLQKNRYHARVEAGAGARRLEPRLRNNKLRMMRYENVRGRAEECASKTNDLVCSLE